MYEQRFMNSINSEIYMADFEELRKYLHGVVYFQKDISTSTDYLFPFYYTTKKEAAFVFQFS